MIQVCIRRLTSFFTTKDSLVELGIVLLSMKEYSDSLEIFMEALEMRESEADDMVLPEEIKESNLKVAKVLNNVGCVNFENSKFEAAKDAFVEAIKLQKKALGEVSSFSFTNPATKPGFLTMASTMCNKGYIELEQENYKESIAIFNESLIIQKMLLGADNKLVLSTYDNIGFAYAMNESYGKSLAVSIISVSTCFRTTSISNTMVNRFIRSFCPARRSHTQKRKQTVDKPRKRSSTSN